MAGPPSRQKQEARPLDSNSIDRFMRIQEKEADARIQEAKNQAQQNEANRQIALASIEAQKQNLSDNRVQYNKHLIHRYVFIGLCLIILLLFCGFAIRNGATAIVIDMLKIGGSLIVGGFGGYFAGKNVGLNTRNNDQD